MTNALFTLLVETGNVSILVLKITRVHLLQYVRLLTTSPNVLVPMDILAHPILIVGHVSSYMWFVGLLKPYGQLQRFSLSDNELYVLNT